MDRLEKIDGVIITPLKQILSPLGDVMHGIKKADPGYVGFEEAYFSTINFGSIKAWKKHQKMTLNLIVPVGKIRFVLYDNRPDSPTHEVFSEVTLSRENYYRLTIPPNIWLAFKGEDEAMNLLLNCADMEHDPDEIDRKDLKSIDYRW
jgi:dTDP-4-dehydrorhamnose 3,5-epimerase